MQNISVTDTILKNTESSYENISEKSDTDSLSIIDRFISNEDNTDGNFCLF